MDKFDSEWVKANNQKILDYAEGIAKRVDEQSARITQLEKHIHYPHNEVAMKEAAAKAQALSKEQAGWKEYKSQQATCGNSRGPLKTYEIISEAYPPPMRADTEAILALTKFAKRLLNPEDLGHAVTFEVRQLARRALGLPEVKEYDL